MGQTLTHGIYLPDEGERNCYNGLAANWQLLDGAVGTVAEHTSQIAGKAPLVHTHTKSDITDFPVYGTTAGTICEGNDSRLSDARTPVAHTHTKSDVTDLLNSNFIPSANNSYDLGSSSYQWKSVYAQSYYYNGVAWGLDKANVWSQDQSIVANANHSYVIKNTSYTVGEATPSSNKVLGALLFKDSGGINSGFLDLTHYSSGDVASRILTRYKFKNGVKDTTGSQVQSGLDTGLTNSGGKFVRPISSEDTELGTSNNKWKTFNGINPGALSLPNFDSDGYIDLSDNLTENVQYTYTPTVDGWLALFAQVDGFHAENAVGIFNADSTLGSDSFRWAASATAAINLERQTGKYYGSVFLPVKAGYRYYCWLRVNQSTTLSQKRLVFYKAKGNV